MTLGCGRVAGGVAKPPPPPAKQNEPVTPPVVANADQERSRGLRSPAEVRNG